MRIDSQKTFISSIKEKIGLAYYKVLKEFDFD